MNKLLCFFIRNLTTGLTAIKPSPTFPSNSQQPLQQPPVSPNNFFNNLTSSSAGQSVQSPLNLNNNTFVGGLGQMSNSTNRMPMNQLRSIQQSAMQPPPFMQPNANPLMPSNSISNQTKNGTSVSLSAQEINDFLS